MSDNQPFGGGTATAVADESLVDEASDGRRVKPLALVVAVAVVLAVGVAAYFLLFSGGGSDPSGSVVPAGQVHASTSAKASAKPTAAPSALKTAPAVPVRDPFAPLAVPAVSATGAPSASSSASTSAGSGVSAPAGATQVVSLKSVSQVSGSASLTINNKSYIAHLGETFATYFQLRGLSAGCGYFLYGDMSFQLCGTQSVTLKS